jgi:hypothetical protein
VACELGEFLSDTGRESKGAWGGLFSGVVVCILGAVRAGIKFEKTTVNGPLDLTHPSTGYGRHLYSARLVDHAYQRALCDRSSWHPYSMADAAGGADSFPFAHRACWIREGHPCPTPDRAAIFHAALPILAASKSEATNHYCLSAVSSSAVRSDWNHHFWEKSEANPRLSASHL